MATRSGLGYLVRHAALRLVPATQRDWVEGLWAEARVVPAGRRRLAWRAGCLQLIAREALMRRRIAAAAMFVVAAAAAAWAAWPGPPAYLAATDHRVLVIVTIAALAGLPLLARRLFGPASSSRTGRALRIGTYAVILALVPARSVIEELRDVPPRAGLDLRVYAFINNEHRIARTESSDGILFLVIMVLCALVMFWLTSQRSRVAPATLIAGAAAGAGVGIVVYAVAPFGLSKAATNPWLPGSDVDPLVLLAWILVLFAPVAASLVTLRRCRRSGDAPDPAIRARQILAAGLVTNLVGALLVTALGTGTTALMLKAAWLRTWLFHGPREFFGIAGLRSFLAGNPAAIAYGHELTASVNSSMLLVMCVAFPLIALALTGLPALGSVGSAETDPLVALVRPDAGPA